MLSNYTVKGVLLVALVTALLGCGGEGAHIDGLFNVSAKPVTLDDNSPGLQFFARSTADVDVFKVVVSTPNGEELIIEGNNATVYEGQLIQMQEDDTGFYWIAGQWSFRFVGNLSRGTRASFDVTELVSVGL